MDWLQRVELHGYRPRRVLKETDPPIAPPVFLAKQHADSLVSGRCVENLGVVSGRFTPAGKDDLRAAANVDEKPPLCGRGLDPDASRMFDLPYACLAW